MQSGDPAVQARHVPECADDFGWAKAGEITSFKEWQDYTEGYLGD